MVTKKLSKFWKWLSTHSKQIYDLAIKCQEFLQDDNGRFSSTRLSMVLGNICGWIIAFITLVGYGDSVEGLVASSGIATALVGGNQLLKNAQKKTENGK